MNQRSVVGIISAESVVFKRRLENLGRFIIGKIIGEEENCVEQLFIAVVDYAVYTLWAEILPSEISALFREAFSIS